MTPLALWRHEVRRAGWAALCTPPATAALVLLVAILQRGTGGNEAATARTFQAVLEMAMPLAAGVAAGSLIGRDSALEIQLSVVRAYRATLLRRLTVLLAWIAVLALITTVALTATGWWHRWPVAHDPVLGQLTWLAPTVWLGGLGFLLGAILRSPAATGGLITAVWLLDQLLANPLQQHYLTRVTYLFATTRGAGGQDWLANRLVLLGTGALLLGVAWFVLARTERLLTGEDA